jgi:peptide/nickel transport system permease protein
MVQYIIRRTLLIIPTLIVISLVTFIVIQLPPGDYMTSYMSSLLAQGENVDDDVLDALRVQYGLDRPMYQQYLRWVWRFIQGDMGVSFLWDRPVSELIWGRVGLTFAISFTAMIIQWIIAIPLGIYSAVRQYSILDYILSAFTFVAAGIPHFLIALVIMWVVFSTTGFNVTGIFSRDYVNAPWSWERVADLLKHIWVAVIILGFLGGAGLMRTMRANLLDELNKPYVQTARAKGVRERKLLTKYPVRVALNPFVSTVGWRLPALISGTTITSIVLGLPTAGPLLFEALLAQDMFLAGSFLMILSILTVIGTFLSDILLGALDPRIRFE